MKRKSHSIAVLSLALLLCSFSAGCGQGAAPAPSPSNDPALPPRETAHTFLTPETSGTLVYDNSLSSIDCSNSSEGYIMIRYIGEASKAKVRITIPDEVTYTYTLFGNEYETFPLSGGDGTYQITVYEHVQDKTYAVVNSQTIDVTLADEFRPFLYPNYYSWYTADTEAVNLGIQMSDQTHNDLEYLSEVYSYIIKNITRTNRWKLIAIANKNYSATKS